MNKIKRTIKTLSLAVVAVFVSSSLFAADVVYLKALGTDETTRETMDGTSWATAFTSVHDAVAAAEAAGKPLYVAAGLYTFDDTITLTAELSIYGGFAGESESETIEGRDIEANPTIFSGDKTQDDYWVHYTPSGYTFSTTDVTDPADSTQKLFLIKDGAVQMPPAFTEDYDGYRTEVKGTNVGSAFTIKYKAVIDGVTFTGFKQTDVSTGVIQIKENKVDNSVVNAGSIVNNCTFIGNQTAQSCVYANVSDVKITNTKFLYTWGLSRGSGVTVHGGTTMISNCVFLCSSRTGDTSGNIINGWSGTALVKDCVMARCAVAADGKHNAAYGGPGNLFSAEGGSGAFVDCVMTNCYTATSNNRCIPLVNPGRTKLPLVRCYFANNRVVVKPAEGLTYLVFGQASEDKYYLAIDSCTFVSNTIKATEVAATSGSYLMALMGNRVNKNNFMIVNSTFDNNFAETVEAEGVTPILCRGVSTTSTGVLKNQIALANCTFTGDDNGLYDIVQYGYLNSEALNIINCIFEAKGEAQVNPIYADVPSLVNLYSCVIQNKFSTDDGFNYFDLASDKIPLVKVYYKEGEPLYAYKLDAKTPNVRTTCDVAVNRTASFCGTTVANSWAFRTRDEGAAWQSIGASIDGINGSAHNNNILADAFGAARPAGEFTRGTIQPLTGNGENGATLILRREPFTAGTFSDEAVQSVALGGTTKPVTATTVNVNDYQFKGWYKEDGEPYSSDATLTIASLSETPTILTAKFDTPSVKITFDLGEYGTFDDNNSSTITKEYPSLAVFPKIPSYTITEGYYLIPGSFNTPETVPLQAATYTARIITKDTRIIHVVPVSEAPAVQNGESWATAYTDIQTAWNDAALYKGEVWLKKGTYTLSNIVLMQDNVVVRGGFDGTETSADEADPENNMTVISGDVKGDSYWKNSSGSNKGNVWINGDYQTPKPDLFDYWHNEGNNSDNLIDGFTLSDASADGISFDGITFTLFNRSAIHMKASAHAQVSISRCKFLANTRNNTSDYGDSTSECGSVRAYNTSLVMNDCHFEGNGRGVCFYGATDALATYSYVTNCLFTYNFGSNKGGALRFDGYSGGEIVKCTFADNFSDSESNRGGAAISSETHKTCELNIIDCFFENNQIEGSGHATVVISKAHAHLLRCQFINNKITMTANSKNRSACIYKTNGDGSLVVENCYFKGNSAEIGSGTDACGVSSVMTFDNGVATILNSTMEDNIVKNDSANVNAGTIVRYQDNTTFSLVGSLISGSTLTSVNTTDAEIKDVSSRQIAIINSVLHNEAEGYLPIHFTKALNTRIYGSLISNFDNAGISANGMISNVVNVTPTLSNLYTGDDGTIARRPTGGDYRKLTLPVYGAKASGGATYFYLRDNSRPKTPWFRLGEYVWKSDGDTNLTEESLPIADAFGQPYHKKRSIPGPLRCLAPGMVIRLK